MENDQHYKELRSVIDSLPNWTSLNDVQRFIEEDSSEAESEIETEMDSDLSTSDEEEEDDDVEEDEDEEEGAEEEQAHSISIKEETDKNLTFNANISPILSGTKMEKRKACLLEGNDDDNGYDDPVSDHATENKSRPMNDHFDHQQVVKAQRRNDFEQDEENERKEPDYDDHFSPKVPPNHSVIINLNAEINRAIGEGTLLPLHRHINRKINVHALYLLLYKKMIHFAY